MIGPRSGVFEENVSTGLDYRSYSGYPLQQDNLAQNGQLHDSPSYNWHRDDANTMMEWDTPNHMPGSPYHNSPGSQAKELGNLADDYHLLAGNMCRSYILLSVFEAESFIML